MLSRRLVLPVVLSAFSLAYAATRASALPVWDVQAVGASGYEQGHNATAVAVTPENLSSIAYYEGVGRDLVYAEKSAGTWVTTVVDTTGDMGRWVSLAIDAQGNPHISYHYFVDWNDVVVGDLKYAKRSGGVWTIQTVDAAGDVGAYSSLALDAQGNPCISYLDNTNGNLKYARTVGGSWTSETVESAGTVGLYTSLALDNQGNPHIAYQDVTNLRVRYASKSGSTWTLETPSGALPVVGVQIAMDLDSQNRPHIVYYDQNVGKTKYATKSGATWSNGVATALGAEIRGSFLSLKVDAQDRPQMSYYDVTSKVAFAIKNGTYWEPVVVDDLAPQGPWTSLALDTNGFPHLSYYALTATQVYYAVYTDNVSDTSAEEQVAFLSMQAYPNPVRTSTQLVLRTPRTTQVDLLVTDARGRIVRSLGHRDLAPGTHAYAWDGRDDAGSPVAAGVYFAVTRPAWLANARKLVVVR